MTLRRTLTLAFTLSLLTGCQPHPAPDTTATPAPPTVLPTGVIQGQLTDSLSGAPISGRRVALCQVVVDNGDEAAPCALGEEAIISGEDGRFSFGELEAGDYQLVYETGAGDFDAAFTQWAGATLKPGDWAWIRDDLLGIDDPLTLNIPLPLDSPIDRAAYALDTLLLGNSPFALAHTLVPGAYAIQRVLVTGGATIGVTVRMIDPDQYQNLQALRDSVPPLSHHEIGVFDRNLADRWRRFQEGDDSAYREAEVLAILAYRGGLPVQAYEIGMAQITTLDVYEGQFIRRTAYYVTDPQSGEQTVIGWLDPATGDVIEASTSYRHNIRDNPGEWIVEGPEGEQFYHYGFSYYTRWEQILPDPVIALLEDFYTDSTTFVELNLADYQAASRSFGGHLGLIPWDNTTANRIQEWLPPIPPFVCLPDSGTVDIRRDRFAETLTAGQIVVNEQGIADFLTSEEAQNNPYIDSPSAALVRDILLTPYRSAHLFSNLEAAIILAATASSERPLEILISDRIDEGFEVSPDRVLLIARSEVANVLLGYPGALNSRWAHEMGHVVDFLAPQYDFQEPPSNGSRCEPVKYIMEFMWWVQRYPGDAEDWDWRPINSGLALARLLTGIFPNSDC
nr:carboxypeptidase regulatory-like domain-containing protein [Anaerolineae bacterium]